ncbi:S1 family peptidase [Allorhizocola rhizosphaerae]|uniref:S1 family peptidase n=1 Tax=Allorhizocola rhizosphaerae TaxID=1872709 RepID=UPI0013C2BE1B|nr:S1 family peptidase [Allorhizocola rhizosphaerae]
MHTGHRRLTTLALATLLVLGFGHVAAANAAEGVTVDESKVDALALSVSEERATFGGISVDGDGKLTVRYAGAAGLINAKTKLAKHTGVKVDGGKRSKVDFVEVKRSLRELDAVRDRLKRDAALKKVLSRHFVDVERNIVSVGVTQLTPEVEQGVKAQFGELVELHVAAREKRASSRTDDFEPWAAGIRINASTGGCTAAYVIRNTTTPTWKRFVTAGHCGPYGTNWYNNGDYVGWSVFSELTEDRFDYAYIGGSTYTPWTYTGSATSTSGLPITGTYLSLVGRKFCTNGATSGETCQGTVTAIDSCVTFSDGITTCFLDVLQSDFGGAMARPGDSGGAVIAYVGGQLKIGGIIIGGSNPAYFHSYHYLQQSGWTVDF